MSKMTEQMIKDLYGLGKSVYKKELKLDNATEQMLNKYNEGEISKSSADFYIKLVSDFIEGKGSTWNQNSDLVVYYVRKITEEMGMKIGKNALHAGLSFAKSKSRKSLENELLQLWDSFDGTQSFEFEFRNWMKNNPYRIYADQTVYRYIRALENVEDWFSVTLDKQILETTDFNELNEIRSTVESTTNYDEINNAHGNGDYSAAFNLYIKFLQETQLHVLDEDWWPSLSDYDLGLSKQDWVDIISDPSISDPKDPTWLEILAMFYDYGGEATCKQLGDKFGLLPMSISGSCTQLAKHIYKQTGCKLFNSDKKDRYWPILFQGRDANKDEPGSFVWKLRPELYDALTELDILRFLPNKKDKKDMTNKTTVEVINNVKEYIIANGFTYEDGVIENFYLSLKSKPFVILAGTSGTGKTRLVKLFAEAIGAEYKMVAVRPDWSDSSDLFGHLDLNGKFMPGEILDFICSASKNPDKPYILCLDEMNLARVEYYLSDFLSIIETRNIVEGNIVSDPLVSKEKYGDDEEAFVKYGELRFPENLYLVGTVNMDETTFPFSRKVLDRANTIEFDYVDLMPKPLPDYKPESFELDNGFLKSDYLLLSQTNDPELIDSVCDKLETINSILRKSNAHVGYRVRDEIVFYMLNNKKTGLVSEDKAFDYEIMQKILPRIQGSSSSIKSMLIELFKYCLGNQSSIDSDSGDLVSHMASLADDAKYKLSAKKIGYMMERYEEDGFTSYWL